MVLLVFLANGVWEVAFVLRRLITLPSDALDGSRRLLIAAVILYVVGFLVYFVLYRRCRALAGWGVYVVAALIAGVLADMGEPEDTA